MSSAGYVAWTELDDDELRFADRLARGQTDTAADEWRLGRTSDEPYRRWVTEQRAMRAERNRRLKGRP